MVTALISSIIVYLAPYRGCGRREECTQLATNSQIATKAHE